MKVWIGEIVAMRAMVVPVREIADGLHFSDGLDLGAA